MSEHVYVPGIGSDTASIVFVGEAPGRDESIQQRPFVGASGQLFRNVLAHKGISEVNSFITNVCKFRPPNNNIAKFFGNQSKFTSPNRLLCEGIAELYADIARIRPRVVVPMGNTALWALTGHRAIGKRRGSILSISWDLNRAQDMDSHGLLTEEFLENLRLSLNTKVIPTYHPAYVLRQYEHLCVFQTDLGRIKSDSEFPELSIPPTDLIINPPDEDLQQYLPRLRAGPVLAYDIETVSNRLFCVGFAVDPSWVVTVTVDTPYRREFCRELLESEVPKLAQNGLFDRTFLTTHTDIQVRGYARDTMVAQHAAYPELPKGLDFLGSIYTREPYFKDEGKAWKEGDIADVGLFLRYNAKDVATTLRAWEAMSANELQDPAYRTLHDRIVQDDSEVFHDMMSRGILIDLPAMTRARESLEEESLKAQAILDNFVMQQVTDAMQEASGSGKPGAELLVQKCSTFLQQCLKGKGTLQGALNVNSSKQLQLYLYEILGLKPKTKRGTGKVTTDEDALKELFTETGNAILLTIVKIRQKRKRISAYLKVKTEPSGRTFFSINPVRTKTGRSSCGKTTTGFGVNLQTIPHELRYIYIPDTGYRFAYLDYSQAEARIVAQRGGVSRLITAFQDGEDIHSLTASLVLDLPRDQIKEHPHRYLGKRCNHAFNYEMGPLKFWTILARDADTTGVKISRSEAKKLRERHFMAYPELRNYWELIRSQLRDNRTLINPFGRKRVFLGRLDDNTFREAFSHYAQSTVADMVRKAMAAVHRWIVQRWRSNYPDTRIVMECHDALLLQFPMGAEDDFIPRAKELMTIPFDIEGTEVIIPVDAAYGNEWEGESWQKYITSAN